MLIEDIRSRKETQLLEAIRSGRSIVRLTKENELTRKRMFFKDPNTGTASQEYTERTVTQFFESLYTPKVPLPFAITPSTEPILPFLREEISYAIQSLRIGHAAGDDKVKPDMLTTLSYADDVIIVAKNRVELRRMLTKVIHAAGRVGLEVHPRKSILLTSSATNREQITTRNPIIIDNLQFDFVESATYLGGKISLPLDHPDEIEHRIRLGWFAWSKLSYLLSSRLLPIKTRRRVFESCVTAAVLYGSEVWAMRASEKERLSVTQRKMERKMLGVTLKDRWRNERVRGITKLRDLIEEGLKRKARWALVRRMGRAVEPCHYGVDAIQ
ncbi:hypothetical protein PMAYCL1PPCAC_10593 [Pristionchus mayeri]|uniref:Reverse transcriptase domain-containing protein n=1 Tax=Pristionchus mayeri TaxID=1317129 RepID=A0AAN5C7J0_9BILA|nr:hypothetical protein PMAYCL1PPCAC_10593 [Pristionchus mayeri]